jgi:uncharacterized protein (TIGR02996 family)
MRIGNLNTALRYGLEDDASFHSKIKENTEEHTPSLVYSDWLREQGREGEADFIKGSVEQDRGASSTGFRMPDGNRTVTAFNWGGRYNVYLWHHDASAPNGSIYWLMKKVPADVAAAHVGRLVANGVLPAGPNTDQLLKTEEPQKHFSFGESLKYSVADEGSFHSKLVEQPDDHTAHSVYADFLREQGKEQTAHFIRRTIGATLVPDSGVGSYRGHNEYGDTTGGVHTGVSPDKEHSGWSLDHNGDDTSGHLLQLYQSHNGHTIEWRHVTRDDPRDTIEALRNEGVKITSTQLRGVKDAVGEWEEEQGRYGTLAQALKYTLATEADFHTALHNDPDEASNAGVYADFLQEQGKDAHAELIRHHIAVSGTGGVPHSEQSWEAEGVAAKPSDRPALHTKVHLIPKHDYNSLDFNNLEPVGYAVHLNQMSPDRLRSVSWESGVLPLHHALDLHKRLVGEGAQNDPRPTPVFGESRPVKGSPVEIYSEGEQPVRYAAVPEHDIHSDYSPAGVAPRIGHLLNRIAGENSDAGLLAEGVLRTGDHSLLKILADKLDDDGHELGKAIDWRHAERAIKIDKHVGRWLEKVRDAHFQGSYPHFNRPAEWVTRYLTNKDRLPRLNRQSAVKELKGEVPDATKDDFHHSLMRHADNEEIRYLHQIAGKDGEGRGYVEIGPEDVAWTKLSTHLTNGVNDWVKTLHNERLKKLGTTIPDPHSYTDTRPANTRYRLAELVAKYATWKAPVGGLIVKESPLAVTGTFSEGGSFTPDLTKLGKTLPTEEPAKKPNLRQLLKRLRDRKRG